MSQSAQFYGLLAVFLTLSVLLYFGLRKNAPAAARLSLALGGAIAGGFLAIAVLFLVLLPFRDGWNLFGLFFWGLLILPLCGGLAGLLAAFWWTELSPTRRRGLAIAALSILLVAPIAVFVVPHVIMFAMGERQLDDMRARGVTLYEFTASQRSVVFPIPTRDGDKSLVVVDRASRHARLIGEHGFSFDAPRLSWDGERLLLVRRKKESSQHELISCFVKSWRCRLVLRTNNDVVSPVEVDPDTVIYSSSPLVTLSDRKRYSLHDFYLIKIGSDPIQLTNVKAASLHSINVSGDKILFGAISADKYLFPRSTPGSSAPSSEVFELAFEREPPRIAVPKEPLVPQFSTDGYSVFPATSQDGRIVAVLRTALGKGRYRFNMVVTNTARGSLKHIDLEGEGFSRAAFAGEKMLFNELMSNRYRVRAWSPVADTIEDVFEIEFSRLPNLERISPLFVRE